MSYNPPRSGLINAGPRRNPYAAGGSVIDRTGQARVTNSNYYDKRDPQAVYNQGMSDAKRRYDSSALKNFFDFVQGDQVKGLVDGFMENQAERQLGDLIANSPDIVEGWKKGSPQERAYVSNLNPFAQNLIEESLSEQVANEYVGSVSAGLAASELLKSATATPEQIASERSRIMAGASEKTGYGSLNPYWIAQTAGDVSRIQAATEAKIDAERQQNKAALGVTKYGDAQADYWAKQSALLGGLRSQMSDEETTQAYMAMSEKWEEDIKRASDATLVTPSGHLRTLLEGIETQAAKMIASGEEEQALQFLEDMQKAATVRDIVFPNGVNYWQQRDAQGNSGIDLLNGIQRSVQRQTEEGERSDAKKWAESVMDKYGPDELLRMQRKLFPGQQDVVLSVLRGDREVDNMTSPEQDKIALEFISRGGSTDEATRLIEENQIPWSSPLAEKMMRVASGDPDATELEVQTSFQSAITSERTTNQINQLAFELTSQKMAETEPVKALMKQLRVADVTDEDEVAQALERRIRVEAFSALEEQDAAGKFDEEGAPSRISVAQELLLQQIETLRKQANFKPAPKEKSDTDPNLQPKEWLQSYAERKANGDTGLDLYDQEFIDLALKDGIIQQGQNNETKARKLSEYLLETGISLKVDGKAVYSNRGQVQKIMRGELDPFTLQKPELNPAEPIGLIPTGSRRRFYKRPEPTAEDLPNPFAEPPRMIDMPPMEEEQEVSSALQSFKQGLFTIANVAVDVLTGAAPASAQVEFEDNAGELAQVWARKKPLGVGTPPLPQINGNVVVRTVPISMSTPRHPYFVAIGIAEGTRTPDGGFTKAWFGHGDPGDGNYNRGTVSGGRGPTRGMTPEQVDNYYMKELTGLALAVAPVLQQYGMKPNAQIWHRTLFNYLDLHVQSPAAARDFLRKIPEAIKAGGQIEAFAKIRADSYRDPATGRLYTSFASYADLLRDQRSRAGAYDYRKRL